jgi:hypothetical protein
VSCARRIAVGVAGASLCVGCQAVYDETTFVTVRDPHAVVVTERLPSGREVVLPAGGAPTSVAIASEPPLLKKAESGDAEITRAPNGAISITCPGCLGNERGAVVSPDGAIALSGTLEGNVAWSSLGLGMRFTQRRLVGCGRRRGLCPKPALALALGTPTSNVVAVEHQKKAPKNAGFAWASVVLGSLVAATAVPIVLFSGHEPGRPTPAGLAGGAAFLGFGGFFVGMGAELLLARDSWVRVYPSAP